MTHAKELSEKLRELNDLSGPELEKHTTAFKLVMLHPLTSISSTHFSIITQINDNTQVAITCFLL